MKTVCKAILMGTILHTPNKNVSYHNKPYYVLLTLKRRTATKVAEQWAL